MKGGDGQLLDGLINTHGKRLYGLCMALCKNEHDANDLYQETWLRVCEKLCKYDSSMPFEPWLSKICINRYRDMQRKLSRETDPFDSSEEKDEFMESIPAEAQEDYSDLYNAIEHLPDKLRVTVILFYFNDLDTDGASKALGIPQGTVKSRLSSAKKLLRKELENEQSLQF